MADLNDSATALAAAPQPCMVFMASAIAGALHPRLGAIGVPLMWMPRPAPMAVATWRPLRLPELRPRPADTVNGDPGRGATNCSRRLQWRHCASRHLHGKGRCCSGGSTWPTRGSPSTATGAQGAPHDDQRSHLGLRTKRRSGQQSTCTADGDAGSTTTTRTSICTATCGRARARVLYGRALCGACGRATPSTPVYSSART